MMRTRGRAAGSGPAYCAAIVRVFLMIRCALPCAKVVMNRCISAGYEQRAVGLARTYVYPVLRVWYK